MVRGMKGTINGCGFSWDGGNRDEGHVQMVWFLWSMCQIHIFHNIY